MDSPPPPTVPRAPAPYIPASRSLPEITVKAVILGVVLSAVLAAANAYLGLFAGLTVSASIPAAVISMGVLRLFRTSNILETNIVQTAASAGESLAAGVIFTIPALIMLGQWSEFDYWETTLIAGFGGLLGVLFTIPLRRALIVEDPLQFPEGVATAEVLKVGDAGGGVKVIATAGIVGALFKFGSTGLKLWGEVVETAHVAGGTILYIGSNLSPALVAVGYIVGLNIAVLVFLGGALNWLVAIPVLVWVRGMPEGKTAVEAANFLWTSQTRYLGVGAMVVGGVWALIRLRGSLMSGVRSSMEAYRRMRAGGASGVERTGRDMPFQWVSAALVASVVPLFLIFQYFTGDTGISAFMAVIMLIAGFLFSAVAGYMAGLVGSSNNPISGITIATILSSALLLLMMMGTDSGKGPAEAIFIGAVVCCAAAIAGDNMQDLKAGHILGATPIKQQIMQGVGTLSAAFVLAPVLTLLLHAYGIGDPTAAHAKPLPAPQATLMASVARGVFEGGLPWGMILIGMAVAALIILADLRLEAKGSSFRMPVLAVAVGIYLPFELSVPIFLGGLIAWAVGRAFRKAETAGASPEKAAEARTVGERQGLLFSAGLITGEALVGIGMAIPIVASGDADVCAFFGVHEDSWPGMVLLALVVYGLYKTALAPRKKLLAD
ncbi:MAG: OPT family oligopeptide transporter [Planctomycetota bacterium]